MINLNETPNAVNDLVHGDIVTVQGREFLVNVMANGRRLTYEEGVTPVYAEGVYLTSMDSRVEEYQKICNDDEADHPQYADFITHVRKSDQSQAAMMRRQELIDILKMGAYSIG